MRGAHRQRTQFAVAPESFTACAQAAISLSMNAPKAAVCRVDAWAPSSIRRCLTAGAAKAPPKASFNRATTASGVPAGATTPCHDRA